jgi:CheY-like chemotaxis protein
MICDDEKEVRSSIRRLLCALPKFDNDYTLITQETFNGIECLYKIYKDFRNGIQYNLLLIDENMPYLKGSTVAYVLKEMKDEGQINNIRIISISGDTYPDTIKYIMSKGVEEIIFKPVNKNSLESMIKSIFSN